MSDVLAVDLGGTKTALALVDPDGNIKDHRKQPAAHTLDGTLDQIAAAVTGGGRAIGVIVPGIFDARTGTAWAPNLWGSWFARSV